jgi:antirestriction protein ArdC
MDTKNKSAELTASVKTAIEQLANETDAARQSELFKSVLKAQAAFWNYSWCNQMLIWRQCPTASYVAGYNTWLKVKRFVRKGEKGIAILAPMFFKDKKAPVSVDGGDNTRIWFRAVYVFDIAQTEGEALPSFPTSSQGERGAEMLGKLLAFAENRGIAVKFVPETCLNGAFGTSRGTEIQIRTNGQDVTSQAAVLAHELAHSLLHWTSDGKKITTREGLAIGKQQRELEAEATAYCLCQRWGVVSPSDFYLATYKVTPAMLLEAVGTIAATVKTIMQGCETVTAEESLAVAA